MPPGVTTYGVTWKNHILYLEAVRPSDLRHNFCCFPSHSWNAKCRHKESIGQDHIDADLLPKKSDEMSFAVEVSIIGTNSKKFR